MRLSKRIIGIAAAVAFAASLATTDRALATQNGTQVEYKQHTIGSNVAARESTFLAWRSFIVALMLAQL